MKRVCVLGCGPAGLLTAHAALLAGHQPTVMSERIQRSMISGAQYLHDPIPSLTNTDQAGMLRYIKLGDKQGYAEKVYGSREAPCSWDHFPEGQLPAWSLKEMYDKLWSEYLGLIEEQHIDSEVLVEILPKYDRVISAIPATAMCHRPHHQFHSAQVTFQEGCPALVGDEDNIIVYSGDPAHSWYRTSRIFGYESTEYPAGIDPSGETRRGIKPTHTTCTCWKDIARVGRFGRWEKGVLVHHAFNDAYQLLVKGT